MAVMAKVGVADPLMVEAPFRAANELAVTVAAPEIDAEPETTNCPVKVPDATPEIVTEPFLPPAMLYVAEATPSASLTDLRAPSFCGRSHV